jgi:hypothetical protein
VVSGKDYRVISPVIDDVRQIRDNVYMVYSWEIERAYARYTLKRGTWIEKEYRGHIGAETTTDKEGAIILMKAKKVPSLPRSVLAAGTDYTLFILKRGETCIVCDRVYKCTEQNTIEHR